MAELFGIRTIADRLVVRLSAFDISMMMELTLDEAYLCRAVLDRAITRLENGSTVAVDFPSFMRTINT